MFARGRKFCLAAPCLCRGLISSARRATLQRLSPRRSGHSGVNSRLRFCQDLVQERLAEDRFDANVSPRDVAGSLVARALAMSSRHRIGTGDRRADYNDQVFLGSGVRSHEMTQGTLATPYLSGNRQHDGQKQKHCCDGEFHGDCYSRPRKEGRRC